jgi:hypothetical protein
MDAMLTSTPVIIAFGSIGSTIAEPLGVPELAKVREEVELVWPVTN